jgi:death-on-curing protein
MNYLTAEQVLFLHARLIEKTGGSHGLRDLGLLISAVERPKAVYQGEDLYPDLFHKAAALMHSLIQNHAFIDGNKRTGLGAAALFLAVNGHGLTATNEQVEAIALSIAQAQRSVDELAEWLARHSERA